jgi:hypothetical protein
MTRSHVIKLTTPFERIKFYNGSPDIALRLAIITQAIIDATNISTKPSAKKIEYEAKKWIFGDSENFYSTCLEAGITPDSVVKTAKEFIKLHHNKLKLRRER